MINIENKLLDGMSFVDLFAGLGGFRLALESLGAKCVYSNEWAHFHIHEVCMFPPTYRQWPISGWLFPGHLL